MAEETKKKTTTKKKATTVKKSTTKKIVAKKTTLKKASTKKSKYEYAVIAISGTQLKVRVGERFEIEKIEGEKGDKVEVEEVLLVSDGENITVGKPYIKDMKVVLEVKSQLRGDKIDGFKYKAKSRYRKRYGYRSHLTRIIVKSIG